MKIIVLNFTKHKMFASVLSVLIATVVLIALTVNIVTNAYNSELISFNQAIDLIRQSVAGEKEVVYTLKFGKVVKVD